MSRAPASVVVRLAALAVSVAMAACGVQTHNDEPPEPPELPAPAARGVDATATSVLVRGRIHTGGITIDPIVGTMAAPTAPATPAGQHRLRGIDDAGAVAFDIRFASTPVADLPTGAEEHFSFVVPVGARGALQLHIVELHTGDGRETSRRARLSARELLDAIAADDVVRVESIGDGLVRVRWDATLFPLLVVQDPATRRILSIARGGDTTVDTDSDTLEFILSEGVRSAGRVLSVR